MKPSVLILGGTLAIVGAVGLVGWTPLFRGDDPGPRGPRVALELPAPEPGPDTLTLVLDESFGRDVLVSRWVTELRGTLEQVELRTRRAGIESPDQWFARARAERREAQAEHPPLPSETPSALPDDAPRDGDCIALRVEWHEALGIHHTLVLHDCFVVATDDWALQSEATVRLAQFLFRPEADR